MVLVTHGNREAPDRQCGGLVGRPQIDGRLQQRPKFRSAIPGICESPDFLQQLEQLEFLSHKKMSTQASAVHVPVMNPGVPV